MTELTGEAGFVGLVGPVLWPVQPQQGQHLQKSHQWTTEL